MMQKALRHLQSLQRVALHKIRTQFKSKDIFKKMNKIYKRLSADVLNFLSNKTTREAG